MHHKELGRVVVTLRRNSRHITARWKDGLVSLNVPHDVCLPDIHRILDDLAPKLLAARPEVFYRDGQLMQFPHAGFVIRRQTFAPSRILGTASLPLSAVEVGSDWNFDDPSTSRAVSDMLCKVAYRIAPQTLLPRAREIADSIGRHPAGWTGAPRPRPVFLQGDHLAELRAPVSPRRPLRLCDLPRAGPPLGDEPLPAVSRSARQLSGRT